MSDQTQALLSDISQSQAEFLDLATRAAIDANERNLRLDYQIQAMTKELKSINWMINICALAAFVWLIQYGYHYYKS